MFTRIYGVLLPVALLAPAHAHTAPYKPVHTASTAGELIGLTAAPADAQPPRVDDTLSLDDALTIAAESNPLLRGARSEADASMGALQQAGARPNPEVSLLQEGFGGEERTTTALINQKLELGGQRGLRLDVASYGRELALASLDGRAAAVRADVISAFYGLLAAQQQLEVTQESADIAARSADLVAKRARAGKISPVEATKARIAATGAQIELATSKARVAIARETLANVSGSAAVANRTACGDLEIVPAVAPLPQLLQRLDDAPVARVARAEMLRSNALVATERAKRMPDITVSAGMKRITASGTPGRQAVIGITIPLPLFDTNKGAILEAFHQAEKASADLDSERQRWRLDVTQAYANFESSTQEARRLKDEVLPAARESLDAMSRGFELGKFSFLDVLDTQRTLFQVRSQHLRALTDAHQAYADLGRLMGTPIRATLSPSNFQP
jgi:cobalt-zinc-cadmium efflux system outer membrane protein